MWSQLRKVFILEAMSCPSKFLLLLTLITNIYNPFSKSGMPLLDQEKQQCAYKQFRGSQK